MLRFLSVSIAVALLVRPASRLIDVAGISCRFHLCPNSLTMASSSTSSTSVPGNRSSLEIKKLFSLHVDTVSLLITNMSGEQLLRIDDVAAHVRMHPYLLDVPAFLEFHEHKLGGPWPRLELVMLDARESGDDVPEQDRGRAGRVPESVLREDCHFLHEISRCAELVWADSDVTIGGLVGCLPVGVRLEIRLAVMVRTDRFRLEYHPDGCGSRTAFVPKHYDPPRGRDDAPDKKIWVNFDRWFHLPAEWRSLVAFWCYCLVALPRYQDRSRYRERGRCAKMIPHVIGDLIEAFRARGESLADIRLADANLLGWTLCGRSATFSSTWGFGRHPCAHDFLMRTGMEVAPFYVLQNIVLQLLAVLERTNTLEHFKSGCCAGLLALVDWEHRRLRGDFVPGETFVEFQRRAPRFPNVRGSCTVPCEQPSCQEQWGKVWTTLAVRVAPDMQMLGEMLYPRMRILQPERAAKITGRMLAMDNAVLLGMLDSDVQLREKVRRLCA